MKTKPPKQFCDFAATLQASRHTIWLGQSVDTSIIHTSYRDYIGIPILTSIGCVIRNPTANGPKFDLTLRDRVGARKRLMVDSGGFVLMMRNETKWSAANVTALYRRIDAEHLVSLDIPPNRDDTPIDRAQKYKRTLRNYSILFDSFGERVIPVVHGAGVDETEVNCKAILRIAYSPQVVGIGGLVPTLQLCGNIKTSGPMTPQAKIIGAIRCVRAYFPKSHIHLFGVGSLHTVLGVIAAGANSVDSIGWRQAAGFGSVYIPGRHRRLLTERARESPCRPFANEEDLDLLAACRCPACRESTKPRGNLASLRSHFKPRAAHNIWVLYSEIAGFLDARSDGRGAKFLSDRLSEAWLSV